MKIRETDAERSEEGELNGWLGGVRETNLMRDLRYSSVVLSSLKLLGLSRCFRPTSGNVKIGCLSSSRPPIQ